jgi:hypothetical protein
MLAGLLPDLKSVIDRVQTLLDATAPVDDDKAAEVVAAVSQGNAAEMKRLHMRMVALNTELAATAN